VAAEIGLATIALIGAGLFVRSLQAAQRMDLGFDSPHIGFVGLNPGQQHYGEPRAQQLYLDAVAARARCRASERRRSPRRRRSTGRGVHGLPRRAAQNPSYRGSLVQFNDVSSGYFDALRIPLREGRDFDGFDRPRTKIVGIVNEALAKQLWPGQDALRQALHIVQQAS